MKRTWIIWFVIINGTTISFAQNVSVLISDPVPHFVETSAPDSSDADPDDLILKIEYDFDSDGVLDMALSTSSDCGNAGCNWTIYVGQPSGGYRYLDWLFFRKGVIHIEELSPGTSQVTIYSRSSAEAGSLSQYRLSAKRIEYIYSTDTDTTSWAAFERISHQNPTQFTIFACNLLQYMRTRQAAWRPW